MHYVYWNNNILCRTGLKPIYRLKIIATSSTMYTLKQNEVRLCTFVVYNCFSNCIFERDMTSFYAMAAILSKSWFY